MDILGPVIPAPKSTELVDKLKELTDERRPSALVLQRLRREAQSLMKSSAADAHMVLGTLDALEFDVHGYLDHYRVAMQLSPERSLRVNFCVIGRRVLALREIYREAAALLESYPDDLHVLRVVEDAFFHCGDVAAVFGVHERRLKLGDTFVRGAITKWLPFLALAERMQVNGGDVLDRIDVAAGVLRDAKEPVFGVLFDIGSDGVAAFSYSVEAPASELTDYSIAMADAIIDRFENPLSDLITISCLERRELHTGRIPFAGEAARP